MLHAVADEIEFVVTTASINEGDEYEIELRLVDAAGNPLSHSEDISATLVIIPAPSFTTLLPGEYEFSSTVTIPAGEVIGRALFRSLEDGEHELDKFVTLQIKDVTFVSQNNRDMFTITVLDDDAELGFSATTYSVSESAGGVTITLDIAGRLTEDVTLNYEIASGTASETEDYIAPLTREVPLSAGANRATLFVEIVNDDLYENADMFSVRLVEPDGGLPFGVELVTAYTETVVTIINDDEIEIGFVEGMYTFLENQRRGTAQVRYSGSEIAPGVEVLVYYSTTVEIGDSIDINDVSGTLVLSSNNRVYNINFPITDDNAFNRDTERYTVSLGTFDMNSGLTFRLDRVSASLNVLTDDVLDFGFSVTEYEVNEGSGTVELEVSVLRNRIGAGERVVVSYSTTPGSATSSDPSDFESVTGEVILSSTATVVTFAIPIVNDDTLEDSESFVVTLRKADGRDTLRLSQSEATVTILDDNDPVTVGFGSASYSVREDQSAVLDVGVLSGGLERDITVNYDLRGDSAVADVDYVSVTGTVVLSSGASETLSVVILDDDIFEFGETFTVVLTGHDGPSAVTLGLSEAVVRIDDNELRPTVDLEEIVDVSEGETVTVIARLSGELSVPVELTLGPADADYQITIPTLVIPAGSLTVAFELIAIDDNLFEGVEEKTVELGVSDNVVGLGDNAQPFKILDAQSRSSLSLDPVVAVEEGDDRIVTVRLNRALESILTVTVSTTEAIGLTRATNAIDYRLSADSIRIPVGALTATFTLEALEDLDYEGDEEFRLVLTPVGDLVDLGTLTRTVTILDNDLVTVGFENVEYAVVEGGLSVTVVVVADRLAVRDDITLSYRTVDGSARVSGGDYVGSMGEIVLSAGTTSTTIEIFVKEDDAFEYDEEFTVVLVAPAVGLADFVLISGAVTSVTIENDDKVTVGFEESVYRVSENVGALELPVVVLDGSIDDDTEIEVRYSVIAGTAEAGSDYEIVNGMLTLSSSGTSAIEVLITDDSAFEYDETFTVVLAVPVGVMLTAAVTEVTIENDDTVEIGFERATYVVDEDSGEVELTVAVLNGSLGDTITLNYITADGTAVAGEDYTAVSSSLTLSSDMSSATFMVSISDDALFENDERFSVSLSGIPSGVILTTATADVTIDNDDTVEIGFESVTYSVSEGAGEVTVSVRVVSGVLGDDLTLNYATVAGTAVSGEDYDSSSRMLTLSPSATEMTFTVSIIDDSLLENDETFTVVLVAPEAGLANFVSIDPTRAVARVTIENDDAITVGFEDSVYSVSEGVGGLTLTVVVLTGSIGDDIEIEVPYSVVVGSAEAGSDYVNVVGGVVTFGSSLTSAIEILITDDNAFENDETFTVVLGVPAGGLASFVTIDPTRASTEVTIENDDEFRSTITLLPFAKDSEQEGIPVLVRVGLDEPLGTSLTVELAVDPSSTAVEGEDFTLSVTSYTIAAGVTEAAISLLTTVDDQYAEPDETIVLVLVVPGDEVELGVVERRLTIIANDLPEATLRPADLTITEGDSSQELYIELTQATFAPVEFRLRPSGDADTSDYMLSSLVLPAGASSLTVTVSVLDDAVYDGGTERVDFELEITSGPAELGTEVRASLTIEDNESRPTVSLDEVDDITEGEVASVIARLSGAFDEQITLDIQVMTTTVETLSSDYEILVRRVDIPAGALIATFAIKALDDSDIEDPETLVLELRAIGPVDVVDGEQTLTILDANSQPSLSLDSIGVIQEGASRVVTARLNRALPDTLMIALTTLAIEPTRAADNLDYVLSSKLIEITAGALETTFTITVTNDVVYEGDEEFLLTLNPVGDKVDLGTLTRKVTIRDNEAVPSVSVDAVGPVSEGDTVTLTVRLSGVLKLTSTVSVSVVGGTANSLDYELPLLSIVIPAGELTNAFELGVLSDDIYEETETLELSLSGTNGIVDLGMSERTVELRDDDDVPQVSLDLIGPVTEAQGVSLVVRLSGKAGFVVTVELDVDDSSTAETPADYVLSPLSVEIPAGSLTGSVMLRAVRDTISEETETVVLDISALRDGRTLSESRSEFEIIDGERSKVSLVLGETEVEEGVTLLIEAELDEVLNAPVTVQLDTDPSSTAVEGTDYILSPVSSTIDAGQRSAVIATLEIIDDEVDDFTQTLTLLLSVPGDEVDLGVGMFTLTIGDNDPADVVTATLRAPTPVVSEGSSEDIYIELSKVTTEDVRVALTVELGGTAKENVDYELSEYSALIPAGTSGITVAIRAIDDDLYELTERLVLGLSVTDGPATASLLSSALEVLIEENDPRPTVSLDEVDDITEGDGATVTVRLDAGVLLGFTLTLELGSTDLTTDALTDYRISIPTVVISPESSIGYFEIETIDDNRYELLETFELTLLVPGGEIDLGTSTIRIVIKDDQPRPTVDLDEIADISEGSTGLVTARLSAPLGFTVTLELESTDITADILTDYQIPTPTVVIPVGSRIGRFEIETIDDDRYERAETFTLTLLVPGDEIDLGTFAIRTVTIVDDQPQPTVSLEPIRDINEGETVKVIARLSAKFDEDVELVLGPPSADYEISTPTMVISAGQLTAEFGLYVRNDGVEEGTEYASLNLSVTGTVTTVVSVSVGEQTFAILDANSRPSLSLDIVPDVREGGSVEVTARLNRSLGSTLMITVLTLAVDPTITAEHVEDYTLSANTIEILANELTATITLTAINDVVYEGEEQFVLSLDVPGDKVDVGTLTRTVKIVESRPVPTVSLDSVGPVSEGSTEILTVRLNGAVKFTSTVSLTVIGGTADSTEDYTLSPLSIAIPSGELTATVEFRALDDDVYEDIETVELRLSGTNGVVNLGMSEQTIMVVDTDQVKVGFVASTIVRNEGDGKAEVTLAVLDGTLSEGVTVTVSYSTSNGEAISGSDYMTATGIVTLSSTTTSVILNVPLTNDELLENDETFEIVLSALDGGLPDRVTLDPMTAMVTIMDDDTATIGFVLTSYEILENGGQQEVEIEIKSGTLAEGVTVAVIVSTEDGTATTLGGDYIPTMRTRILSSMTTQAFITIPINLDRLAEGKERFGVVLSLPADSSLSDRIILDPMTATVTITDELILTIGFVNEPYFVSEEAGGVSVAVGILSEGVMPGDGIVLTATYVITDVSALAGEDYQRVTSILSFEAATSTQEIFIPITDDSLFEGDELFRITLTDVEASLRGVPLGTDAPTVQLNPQTALVTILDDDIVEIGFEPVTYEVGEGSGTVTLTARLLNGSLGRVVTLTYATADDSARAGEDYSFSTGTVTLSPGVTEETFTISFIDDVLYENTETFTVVLSGAPVGVVLTNTVAFVTITDDEPAPVAEIGFDSVTYSVSEEVSRTVLTVSVISGVLLETVTLSYTTVDGSALSGEDYELSTGAIELSPLDVTATIEIAVLDDRVSEGTEVFFVSLGRVSVPDSVLLTLDRASVTIEDTDVEVGFEPVTYSVGEASGTIELRVSVLSGDLTESVTLNYETSDGSAVAGTDYTLTTGTLTLSDTISSFTFTVTILEDIDVEPVQTFTVTLSVVDILPAGVALTSLVAVVTIIDNDEASVVPELPEVVVVTPTLSPSSVTLSEGGTVSLEIVLESASSVDVTLTLVLENEVDGVTTGDYSLTPSEVFISAGTTSTLVLLTALDDPDLEGEERFDLRLVSASSGVTVSVGSIVTVTILESDQPVEVLPVVVVVTPTLSPSSVTLSEGGTVSLEIVLESASSVDVTLTLVLENEVDGVTTSDYSLTPSEVFISAGTTSTLVLLTALDDPDLEGEERFDLRLVSASSGVTVSVGSIVTVTILESDQPVEVLPVVVVVTPTLSPSSVTLSEGGTVSLEIVLESASSVDVTLTLVLENEVDGVTTSDYSLTPSEVFISAGTTSTLVLLTALDDPDLEGEERFDLRLVSASSGVTVSVGSIVTVTILESDQPVEVLPVVVVVTPTLSPSSVTLSEGGTVSLEIVLESASSVDVTLTLVLENEVDGVTTGDYSLTPSEVFISAGTTSTLVLLTALDDPDLEGEERFDLRLVSASSGVTVSVGSVVTVTILESDQPVEVLPVVVVVTPTLSPSSVTLSEGGTVSLEIVLESASSVDVTLTLVLENEVDGVTTGDYSLTPSEVFISAGTTSTLVLLTALDDPDLEGEERFDLRLVSASSGVTVSVGSIVTVTILESDQPVEVLPVVVVVTPTLSPSSVTLSEGGTVSLEIVLESASSVDVTLTLVLENEVGGVTASDYSLTPSEVSISAGTTSTLVLLTALDDPDLEGEERFDLRLVSVSSGVTVSVGSIVTVTILESDQPVDVTPEVIVVTPTLSPSSVTLSEGGTVSLEIVLESASSVDVTLTLVLENEVDGVTTSDYSLTPSEVFISAGTTSTLVLLTALDDPDLEGEERFDLRLVSASSGVTVSVGSVVTVTILESDQPVDITPGVGSNPDDIAVECYIV